MKTADFDKMTEQQLFDKMVAHHVRSQSEKITKKSRVYHEKLYFYTKRVLWERVDKNADG